MGERWFKTKEQIGKEQREEADKLAREASQPTTISGTTFSEAQAAEICAQVRQAINEGFAKARSKIAEVPKSGTTSPSPSVIDLVTPLPSPQQVAESGVLPASPISIASTPSQAGNGGNAPAFSRLSLGTDAASIRQVAATMHWKPIGASVLLWTQLGGRSYMDVLGASLPYLYGG